ncbi:glycoside hydrolase domain-containing protein [uncultured Amnibacterium sp.]|uniref:glycoside hydrolase domain-containing protein n=1 Tax=uncultured Amnibacterium sp. TaxID=1631851 RepID=UPI0035CBD4CE
MGGTHGPCYHPNKSFFSNLNHNWGVVPVYDSLQAPCSGQSDPMSSSTSTAYDQGVTIADHVIDTETSDGFTGAKLAYIDLEPFSNSSSCTAAPKAFVNGYVHELHAKGHKAGLYINATQPGGIPFAGIDNPPDAVWIADYNGKNSAAPDAVDTSGTRTTEWTHDQRLHQYDQNRTAQPSGVNTSVQYDPDAVDAPILTNNVP